MPDNLHTSCTQKMLMKQKFVNTMAAAHPKAATLGIGHPRLVIFLISLAITFVIAMAIRVIESPQYLPLLAGITLVNSDEGSILH